MTASRVLIISGPIGSGKSTAARTLAAEVRASGFAAAVVELDRMYMMLDDGPIMGDLQISRRARRAAATLVDHYVLDGIDLVIAEGTSGLPTNATNSPVVSPPVSLRFL